MHHIAWWCCLTRHHFDLGMKNANPLPDTNGRVASVTSASRAAFPRTTSWSSIAFEHTLACHGSSFQLSNMVLSTTPSPPTARSLSSPSAAAETPEAAEIAPSQSSKRSPVEARVSKELLELTEQGEPGPAVVDSPTPPPPSKDEDSGPPKQRPLSPLSSSATREQQLLFSSSLVLLASLSSGALAVIVRAGSGGVWGDR